MKNTLFVMLISLLVVNFAYAVSDPGTVESLNNYSPHNLNSRSLDPLVNEIGLISWSIDGLGTNNQMGIIQVDKPAGATVRTAYLYAASTWGNGAINTGDIKLDGVDIAWDGFVPFANVTNSYNYYKDVTSLVSSKIDSAAPGRIDFEIMEIYPDNVDGTILAVIFDDPNQTEEVTIAFLFGAQDIYGDQFNIGLADPVGVDTEVYMSLGISFGYQPGGQVSHIDVNGVRLTSSAGGQDDSDVYPGANGSLLTVGGLDDSYDNPSDPYAGATDIRSDDELYTLTPLLNLGDSQITVDTINPSNDDNIFFAAFNITGAAVIGEGCILSPSFATRFVGENHTVTATLQNDLGNPVVGRTIDFEVTSGPHAGTMGSDITDALGKAYFTYIGGFVGIDILEASFLNEAGMLQMAENIAEVVWEYIPNPVTLSAFTAIYNNVPTLNWTTQSESNNLGWNIYRSNSESVDEANQINDLLIPGNGTISEPTEYVYNDLSDIESNTTYWYWLESASYNGETELYGPVTLAIQDDTQLPDLPTVSILNTNYPNPFNPSTMIDFSINQGESGSLTILNTKGQVMETHKYEAGNHQFNWNATNYSSGIYFYKLETQTYSNIKKMIMVK